MKLWVNVMVKECGQQSDSPAIRRRECMRLKKPMPPRVSGPSAAKNAGSHPLLGAIQPEFSRSPIQALTDP